MNGLTPRQRECIALAADGLENAEIGRRLFISLDTVKTHMSKAFHRLGACDRANAVHLAHKAGLLECGNGHGEGA